MRNTLFTVVFCTLFLAAGVFAQQGNSGSAATTRYWDACKPSCGWSGKPSENGTCASCNVSGGNARANDDRSSCDGGSSYTCMGQAPWAVSDDLSYGFAASHSDGNCGKCYELTFQSGGNDGVGSKSIVGKKMVVMISNIGGDVGQDQFDIMIPGGGVGAYNALSNQISTNGGSSGNLGQQYGGFRGTCGNSPSCVQQMCDAAFSSSALSHLKGGCQWFIDWYGITNNPKVNYQKVTCPSILVEVYKGTQTRPSGNNPPPPPPVTTYTLQVARNPTAGGNVAVTVGGTTTNNPTGQSTHNANTSITVAATANSGYTFQNWTAVSGSLPSGFNASSASVTFSIGANVNIRANFQETAPPPTTYTLQVGRSPTAGGNVTVTANNSTQTNPQNSQTLNANTSVTVAAAAATGYTFLNWTAVSGSLPSGFNASGASVTFSIGANVNIRANFEQTAPSTYTLNVSRSPEAGGSVTVNGGSNNPPQSTHNAGASIALAAAPASGYIFVNWTAVSGSLPSGITATSASVTFTISGNVNIRANFRRPDDPQPTTYTLNVSREPAAGGSVTVNGGSNNPPQSVHDSGSSITVAALSNNSYMFENWTAVSGSLPSGVTATDPIITFSIRSDVSIRANFRQGTPPTGDMDTITIEAEDYASKEGSNMVTSTNNGITNIGYIESGYSATYNVSIARAETYTMVFRIASNWDQGQSSLRVVVNGSSVGTITGHTNDWDGYTYVTLNSGVPLRAGSNTVKLEFQTPINVDHFLIISEKTSRIRYNAVRTVKTARSAVTLTASPKGFTAALPANHTYTSYRLVDLQGREVRSGRIGSGVSSLKFNNLKKNVLLLRLEGNNTSTVVKAVTY